LVLDLTDGTVRHSLGVSDKRLLRCDWRAETQSGKTPLTQAIGLGVYPAGFEGLLVRSAADPNGQNLVVFVENLHPGSTLAIVAADQLGD
jgi:RES domain-containing protein